MPRSIETPPNTEDMVRYIMVTVTEIQGRIVALGEIQAMLLHKQMGISIEQARHTLDELTKSAQAVAQQRRADYLWNPENLYAPVDEPNPAGPPIVTPAS